MFRKEPMALTWVLVAILPAISSCGRDDAPARTEEEAKLLSDLKSGKSVDLFAFQGGGVDTVCLSGGYQDPISDIQYITRREFASCSGTLRPLRAEYDGAISFVWPNRCHVIDVDGSDFVVETQNGSSCYNKNQAKSFKLEETPYGPGLLPQD